MINEPTPASYLADLLRDLPSNLTGTDLTDITVLSTTNRSLVQQPDGKGLHISFTISDHALGKMGARGHRAWEHFDPAP